MTLRELRSGRGEHRRTYRDRDGRAYLLVGSPGSGLAGFEAFGPSRAGSGEPPPLFDTGADGVGACRTWEAAEACLSQAADAYRRAARERDLVMAPTPGGDGWLVVSPGESGLRIETWAVDAATIARGAWCGWIEDPGHYWQRMDVAEVHGPFATRSDALADIAANRDAPGIPPARSRADGVSPRP